MGRNKDQKIKRKNAPGIKRNRDRELKKNAAEVEGDAGAMEGLEVECPHCGAAPGEQCVTPGGKVAKAAHKARK